MTNTTPTGPREFAAMFDSLADEMAALRQAVETTRKAWRQAQSGDPAAAAFDAFSHASKTYNTWVRKHPDVECWSDVVADSRRLADWQKRLRLPGTRSMTAITRIRKERAANKPPTPPTPEQAAQRLRDTAAWMYLNRMTQEVERRGGETSIRVDKNRWAGLELSDRSDDLALLHVEGWRYYSSREGFHRASLSYLCGTDDAGRWAVRVPGTVTTVGEALDWLEPAEVKKARQAGKRVVRQGDVYGVETTKTHDGKGELPANHEWRPATRHLVHRADDGHGHHRPVKIAWPVRFVRQRAYEMGRSGSRAGAD